MAYTRWLDARYRTAGLLPAGLHVTLPNEREWEKAARGGRSTLPMPLILPARDLPGSPAAGALQQNPTPQRRYPWGGDPDAERANVGESQIGATSAAGAFALGASPYGAEDLAGNVWEWTRSLYRLERQNSEFRLPYLPDDGRENFGAGDMAWRVLRGGSYGNSAGGVGCGVRFGNFPYFEAQSFGFRVVLSPSTSGR